MAGTNDLADRTSPAEIVANLATLHSHCHAVGARTVALTIPESKASKTVPWYGALRSEANRALEEWAQAQPSERVSFIDAAALVPYSEAEQRCWEPDGLHMSAAGYKAFGERLAPKLADLVAAIEEEE